MKTENKQALLKRENMQDIHRKHAGYSLCSVDKANKFMYNKKIDDSQEDNSMNFETDRFKKKVFCVFG